MKFKFDKEDFQDHSTLVFYNQAIGDNKAMTWEFEGNEYIMVDAYCKNPDCSCQNTFIVIAPKDNLAEGKGFFYNYEKKAFEESEHDIPQNWIEAIQADDDLHDMFRQRHKDMRAAFLEQLQLGLDTKIGRNDPCPCGSGKKYKKCCGI
jgi:hypothetical protein